jgi:hypothetical protein
MSKTIEERMKAARDLPRICAIREFTADGVSVGRCCFYVGEAPPYICPRHGDVTEVQRAYAETGKLTNENPSKQWRRDVLRTARENHIWLNAFACVRPTEQFCAEVGRAVLEKLNEPTATIPSEFRLVGTERELIVRINKS